jgi:hypothetical protein
MSIGESNLMRLVTAQGIDSSDHYIRHGNYIPTAAHNLLSGLQSHELEAALQISTWSKRDGSLGASELAVTRMVFLMNLAILPDLQTQMLLVIECLTRHYSLGTQSFRYYALCSKKIQKLDHIQHNVDRHDLGDPLKWKDVLSGLKAFLHYPDSTLDLGHVLIGTGQVDHGSTWNRLDQRLQGREFAVGVHHCDMKTTLEIILVNLLEILDYLRHHAVREVIDGCERDLVAKRQEEHIVNPSGKTGTQIPQLPLGDNSSPWGDNAVCT